jgi:hypothetical protein
MITDKVPRKAAHKKEYLQSDELRILQLPPAEPLRAHARALEEALSKDSRTDVKLASNAIAATLAKAFDVKVPAVRILGARPLEVTETSADELFGDYDLETALIRLWMRTALKKKPTSYGTFLSTLCHEFCHHLDVVKLGLPNTFHTRGFYERAGLLYHHVRNTPVRQLVWTEQSDGTFRINWPETMRGRPLQPLA